VQLFFDLDGTLTDPAQGITRCIAYALEQMGQPPVSQDVLESAIGPPLRATFSSLLHTADPEPVAAAVALYRERFVRVGMLENQVYEGIPELLADLAARGSRCWVVTSKPWVYAEQIVQHFGLSPYFERVYGPELDGTRAAKTVLIRHVLQQEALPPGGPWMVGDRGVDVEGAKANALTVVGVRWGFGKPGELSGADHVVDDLDGLRRVVGL
jgi:phosphoglycolate phosphatase